MKKIENPDVWAKGKKITSVEFQASVDSNIMSFDDGTWVILITEAVGNGLYTILWYEIPNPHA